MVKLKNSNYKNTKKTETKWSKCSTHLFIKICTELPCSQVSLTPAILTFLFLPELYSIL